MIDILKGPAGQNFSFKVGWPHIDSTKLFYCKLLAVVGFESTTLEPRTSLDRNQEELCMWTQMSKSVDPNIKQKLRYQLPITKLVMSDWAHVRLQQIIIWRIHSEWDDVTSHSVHTARHQKVWEIVTQFSGVVPVLLLQETGVLHITHCFYSYDWRCFDVLDILCHVFTLYPSLRLFPWVRTRLSWTICS